MSGLGGPSESETETSVHTEPSAGDPERDAYGPYRVAGDDPTVRGFRAWWLSNPLNNLWTKKPNLWRTYQAELAGADPAEAVKSGANVMLADLVTRGPTLQEVLDEGGYELEPLPSDEAWFGEPDPAVYAAGTNDLTKAQLAEEVAKGNVATLRQLKQHLASASDQELELWSKLFAAQDMKQSMFVDTPEGRVSMWDLLSYVQANPELAALAQRDINLAVPVEGLTREERLAKLVELAPWRLCSNERRMVLPDAVAAKLPWGLLAGSTWWSRRPSRWLKGLDGRADFAYGLYAHEAAAAALLGPRWGGRNPQEVLADKAFYRDALSHAPSLGMSLLAVASRPLPLQELTQSWEARVRQQLDKQVGAAAAAAAAVSGSSGSQPRVLLSTSSGSYATGSSEMSDDGSSSEAIEAAEAVAMAAAPPKPAAAAKPAAAPAPAVRQAAAVTPAPVQPAPVQPPQQQLGSKAPPGRQQAAGAPVSQPAQQQPAPAPPTAQAAAAVQQQQQQQAASAAAATPVAPVREVAPQHAGLAELVELFDPGLLAEHTELLDMRGTKLREGATIIFTAHPSGALMVQAVSPGLVKDQKSYLLGSVVDPHLTQAVMSLFLDPDASLEPAFAAAAGQTLLAFANGHKTGQALREAAARRPLPGSSLEEGRQLLRHGKWALPAVGQAPQQQPLVKGVRRAVTYQQISAAFESALRAAAAVGVPADEDPADAAVQRRVLFERRHAAEAELKRRLTALGLDASRLSLCSATGGPQMQQDLLSLARPLAA